MRLYYIEVNGKPQFGIDGNIIFYKNIKELCDNDNLSLSYDEDVYIREFNNFGEEEKYVINQIKKRNFCWGNVMINWIDVNFKQGGKQK